MFRCSHTIIRGRIDSCLLKLQLLKYGGDVTAYIYSHITTVLTTHRCILMDYFNNCNFSKHELMRPLMMV
jgi:hypothetical protein